MRIKDVVDAGHIIGREQRVADEVEQAGIEMVAGAFREHLAYVHTDEHVRAFNAAVIEAAEGRWS